MINFKKIGLTALAGSLVAFSANAVELSVSGGSEITYTTDGGSESNTGNPFGAATSIKFVGEGDVGFGTAKIQRLIRDNNGGDLGYSSAWTSIDMGDMGVFSFDSTGGGLVGTAANDDILPTAYEEVWNGIGSASNGTTGISAKNVLGYRGTFAGVSLSMGYAKDNGSLVVNGDGNNTNNNTVDSGTRHDINVAVDIPGVEGLSISGGFAELDVDALNDMAIDSPDTKSWTAHVLYSMGPVSAGIRMAETQVGTVAADGNNAQAASVAFNVNDALTVSLAMQDLTYDKAAGTLAAAASVDIEESITALNAAYTMGAATIRATISDADNAGGLQGVDDEHMEVSLVLAF
jgi:outer membrane protein OmpU